MTPPGREGRSRLEVKNRHVAEDLSQVSGKTCCSRESRGYGIHRWVGHTSHLRQSRCMLRLLSTMFHRLFAPPLPFPPTSTSSGADEALPLGAGPDVIADVGCAHLHSSVRWPQQYTGGKIVVAVRSRDVVADIPPLARRPTHVDDMALATICGALQVTDELVDATAGAVDWHAGDRRPTGAGSIQRLIITMSLILHERGSRQPAPRHVDGACGRSPAPWLFHRLAVAVGADSWMCCRK